MAVLEWKISFNVHVDIVRKMTFWTTFRPMLGLSQDLWIRALKSKQKWLGYFSLFVELMSSDDDSDDKDGDNNLDNGNYSDNENSADDNPKPKSTKRNRKVCTRLLFNFWNQININQVDCLQHYVSNQHIVICVAETSVSLMFYQPARKVKRVQRKMWILIVTKNQFHNRLLTCLFMISNNFWVRTERNCCQRGSNFTYSVLDARIQRKKLCTIGVSSWYVTLTGTVHGKRARKLRHRL